jgi:predicted PurR-regulated permease PerM
LFLQNYGAVAILAFRAVKQIQNLPERVSNAAALLLLVQIDFEGEIHKRILKLFGSIIQNAIDIYQVEYQVSHTEMVSHIAQLAQLLSRTSFQTGDFALSIALKAVSFPPSVRSNMSTMQ